MNQTILEFLYNLASTNLQITELTVFFAVYLPYLIIALLAGLSIFSKDKNFRRDMIITFIVTSTLWFIVFIFKEIFPTQRPFEVLSNIVPLFSHSAGEAFPSGHAIFFGALAAAWFFLGYKRLGFWLGLAAVLITVARVAIGVHWPADVLAGLFIGSIGAWVLVKLLFLKRYPDLFKES